MNDLFQPILKLEESVQEVSTGNLDVSITPVGKNEIGHLAYSFKTMVENLKRVTASLDELTHEIIFSFKS